jgi:N-carbamoylputrescine amidase
VLPLSLFERANNAYFNTVVVVDADGAVLGKYRKSHIPDGPGYSEKFYFSPGDTGFRVWQTKHGAVGVGICWDQWFPEAARSMALLGADVILYPTAIGSEPQNPTWDSSAHWQRVMQGHAAANLVPVAAANRTGREVGNPTTVTFYGSSFITDATGEKVAEAGRDDERVLVAEIDVEANRAMRAAWGLFRDRRPELYGALTTLDGAHTSFDGANETPRR